MRLMAMRFLVVFFAMLPFALPAAECRARSGESTNALVELYTSEGCSSCPPADRWLSTLAGVRGVVPVAFHVNYWDYIGWKDVYADARYTERQRDFARATSSTMVYTPQVVLAGRDYRDWRDEAATRAALHNVNAIPARATLEIASTLTSDGVKGHVQANVASPLKPGDFTLYVAITQNGLASRPTAGENKGASLAHGFAARDLVASRSLETSFDFKATRDWDAARLSIVAFIQNAKTGEVLQALAAPCI